MSMDFGFGFIPTSRPGSDPTRAAEIIIGIIGRTDG